MNTLSFSGTRHVDQETINGIARAHTSLFDMYDRFATGGCWGFDAWIGAWLAAQYPDRQHVVVLPGKSDQVDEWWTWLKMTRITAPMLKDGRISFIKMPKNSSYKQRNQRLVSEATGALFYVAQYPEKHPASLRSGTWQTVRLAGKADLAITGVTLNQSVK